MSKRKLKSSPWARRAMLASASLLPFYAASTKAADAFDGLEEITVTAQFVQQSLQDTPLAITAVNAEMLEARGQTSVEQIANQAPNVTLTTGGSFGGPSLIGFIRGVGQTDFNPALEPGVGLYVDDVYYSTLTGSVLDLLDLDRVEVLRGPQGTLAGKNSIGGSIKLYTKKPNSDNEGYAEASYGTYNAVGVRGASNFTLIPDTLFARVAGVSRSRDGYIRRLDYACTHPGATLGFVNSVQGSDCEIGREGGVRYTAARASLRWIVNDDLEVNFAGDFVNDTSEAPANVLLGVGYTVAPVVSNGYTWNWLDTDPTPPGPPVPGPPIFGTTLLSGCQFIAYGPNSCDPMSPNNPYVNYATYTDNRNGSTVRPDQYVKSKGLSLNLDWKITDNLQLQSITAYRGYDSGFGNDSDASPMPVLQLYQTLIHTQRSQELRLNGKAGSMLDYTVGAFYFKKNTAENGRINLGYAGLDFIHGPDPVEATTWALFAQGMFHPIEKLDVTAGVRYTNDKKDYRFTRSNPDYSQIVQCDLIPDPNRPGQFKPDPTSHPNCLIASLNGTASTFKGTRTDYRLAVSYKWTDDFMTYGQISTGFKGGGINPRPFYNAQAFTFNPEKLTAYEVGAKSQLFNNTVRLNGALFFNKYKDIQLPIPDCTSLVSDPVFGRPCLGVVNAGDADVKGAELEVEWYPIESLQLDASVSYLDFDYTRIDPRVALSPTNPTGIELTDVTPYSPKKKASLGAQYAFELGAAGSVTPRVDVSYQSEVYTDASNEKPGMIDGYTVWNTSLTWRAADKDWQMSLECKNCGDKLYYLSKNDGSASLGGVTFGTPAMPRTYNFSIKRSF